MLTYSNRFSRALSHPRLANEINFNPAITNDNMKKATNIFFILVLCSTCVTASDELRTNNGSERPNILWLVSEDMALDLSCYGLQSIETPNADRLAREGIRFENAFCPSSICSPSRSSFNTGMYATTIRAHDHRTAANRKQPLPSGVRPVSQWFAEAGYHTCLMGNRKLDFNFLTEGKVFQSEDWSHRQAGQPFFALLNFAEPHRSGWEVWEQLPKHLDPSQVELPPIYPDDPVMRASYAKYLDFVVEMDRKLGLVLKRLEEEKLLDKTIIIFFGDNGRTMYRGKQWLYDGGLRVPMIVRYPSGLGAGSVNEDLVSLIDMAPTSLSLAGIEVPATMQGKVILGESATTREYVFASRDLCDDVLDPMRCVRDLQYKLIRNYRPENGYRVARYTKWKHPEWTAARELFEAGKLTPAQALMFAERKPEEELYDLVADPMETHNLATSPDHSEQLDRLRGALDKWMATNNDQPENR